MPIPYPVSKTVISTTQWGIPVTDAINANTDGIAAMKWTPWTNLTLTNGWTNYGAQYALASYRTNVGLDLIQLQGCVASGAWGTGIAALPAGSRPTKNFETICYVFTSGVEWYQLAVRSSDGVIVPAKPAGGNTAALMLNIIMPWKAA